MRGAIPPLPQYAFMAWCLVKHMDNFTFTFMIYFTTLSKVDRIAMNGWIIMNLGKEGGGV
jgi:hypothetical protein